MFKYLFLLLVAGLVFAQQTIEYTFTMPEAVSVIASVFLPYLIAAVNKSINSSKVRFLLSWVIAAIVGMLGVTVAGKWSGDWLSNITYCILASQLSYRLWIHDRIK